MWLIQKLNDIKAAVTHIFILCFLPNSIFFVVLLVLHYGLSKLALVPSSKCCEKRREEICARRLPFWPHWPGTGHVIHTQGQLGK